MQNIVFFAAGWSNIHCVDNVAPAQGFCRHYRSRSANIRLDVCDQGGVGGKFTMFQGPLLFGLINDAEVIDTAIGLRRLTGTHVVGNPDGRQEADDGHDDHDLHQREARLWMASDIFHNFALSLVTVEQSSRRVYIIAFLFAGLPAATVNSLISMQYANIDDIK
jgi:hypothetical protein